MDDQYKDNQNDPFGGSLKSEFGSADDAGFSGSSSTGDYGDSAYDGGHGGGPWSGDGGDGPAWEKPFGTPFERYFETLVAALMKPVEFFETMRKRGPIGLPLIYAVIGIVVGAVVGAIYAIMFNVSVGNMLMSRMGNMNGADMAAGTIGPILNIFMAPVMGTIMLFVFAGLAHLLLVLFQKKTVEFDGTFRVFAYTYGSTSWINLLPFCGGVIAFIWGLILLVIGLDRMHRCGAGMALVIILIPYAVLFCLCAGCASMGMFSLAAAGR